MRNKQEELEKKVYSSIDDIINDRKTLSIISGFDVSPIKKTEDILSSFSSFLRSNGLMNTARQEKELKELIEKSDIHCVQCRIDSAIKSIKSRILSKTVHESIKEILSFFEQDKKQTRNG